MIRTLLMKRTLMTKRALLIAALFVLANTLACEKMLLGPESDTVTPPSIHASRLATILDSLRYAMDLPALAGAIVTDTGIVEARAAGCRRYGGPANVTDNDQFHLGSCGKSFTSVALGLLVDQGKLRWEATLPELFPEAAGTMRPEYRNVTLLDVLSHSAGFVRDAGITPQPGTPTAQRAEIAAWALLQPPAIQHGAYLYSNLGFIIGGTILERISGRTYEDVIMHDVVAPLGLTTAGFGPMGTPGLEDEPLQHSPSHAPISPTGDAQLAPIYNPAGGLHMSVGDWGKYVRWVLATQSGASAPLLSPATALMITTPRVATGDGGYYALGWGGAYYDQSAGGRTLSHSGSNGYNYCTAYIWLNRKIGFLVMSNQGAVGGDWPLGPALSRLVAFQANGN